MPELPEVETTKRGISPHIQNKLVGKVCVRNSRLRWPIPENLAATITGKKILDTERRGKYLLFKFSHGTLIWHLGMSGSLRIVDQHTPIQTHDHVDIEFNPQTILRYNDPRRFGAVLWTREDPHSHKLLTHLGPEPLGESFSADYLYDSSRKKTQAIKSWIMDAKVVVGVGNIYANESLFLAGIHPLKAAGKVSRAAFEKLYQAICHVLHNAITQGGTTLRDFVGGDGKPGYFQQQLLVYGRGGQPCRQCTKPLTEKRIAQRSSVYCTHCQKL